MRSFAIDEPGSSVRALYATLSDRREENMSSDTEPARRINRKDLNDTQVGIEEFGPKTLQQFVLVTLSTSSRGEQEFIEW